VPIVVNSKNLRNILVSNVTMKQEKERTETYLLEFAGTDLTVTLIDPTSKTGQTNNHLGLFTICNSLSHSLFYHCHNMT
jgi:hypothetical protein